MKGYAAHYDAEARTDGDNRVVVRCTQTSPFFKTPEEADTAGKQDGRPFVVADEKGVITVPAKPVEHKKKGGILG